MIADQLSAVVITLNESNHIKSCVERLLTLTDDVIVVDAESSDGTAQIAKDSGARVFQMTWNGYGANKNFGNEQAKGDWIFSVDADEFPDNTLCKNILELNPDKLCVYSANVLTNYCGRWVKHSGWHPLWRKRLFYKYNVKWSDNLVHEKLIFDMPSNEIKLKGKLLHYSYPNKGKHLEKIELYAQLTAMNWIKDQNKPGVLKTLAGPWFRYFKTLILKRAFLDGSVGWQISKMNAILIKKQLEYYKKFTRDKNA